MATANPYAAALASGLASGQQRSIVDPRLKLAEQLMAFKAAPVTTKGGAMAQSLAAALSGFGGGFITNQTREDQVRERAADRSALERSSALFDQREEANRAQAMALATGAPMTERLGGAPPAGLPPQAATPPMTPVTQEPLTAPAMPVGRAAAAPISGSDPRAMNADAAAQRASAMSRFQGPELEAELARISGGRAQAANGMAPGTPFRANTGVGGVFAGLPPPTGAVPNLAGIGATPVSDTGAMSPPTPASRSMAAPAAPAPARSGEDPADLRRRGQQIIALGNTTLGNSLIQQASAIEASRERSTAREDQQSFQRQQAEDARLAREQTAREAREAREQTAREAREARDVATREARAGRDQSTETQRLQTVTQQEAPQLERIASASGVMANGQRLLGLLDQGKINLGPTAGIGSTVRGALGGSNEGDINRSELQRHVAGAVNEILSQAAGPQTDGDAKRAADQILNNLNDPAQVRQGLESLNGSMQRAREIATARVQGRRAELGLRPANLDPYTGVRSNADSARPDATGAGEGAQPGAGQRATPQPGAVVRGFRFKGGDPADQSNWEPV